MFVIEFVTWATIWKWNWTHSCAVRAWSKPLPRARIGHFKHSVETKKKRVKRNQRQNTVKRQKEPITQEQETLFISIAAQMDKTEEEEEEEPIKRATKLYTSQIKKQTKRNNGLIGCCCVFFFVKN